MRLRPAQGRREMEKGHNVVIEEVSWTLAGLALLRLRKCAVVYEPGEQPERRLFSLSEWRVLCGGISQYSPRSLLSHCR